MFHLSENSKKLNVLDKTGDIIDNISRQPCVEFIILPFYKNITSIPSNLYRNLLNFINNCNEKSIFIILTSPICAVDFCSNIHNHLFLKLWIAVKTKYDDISCENLPSSHSSLLILTKNKDSLKHTKTRIAYTYCPYCKKTTKDYGGKKHLYHEFGTLISDVWRHISISYNEYPSTIIDILRDLFGLDPYINLNVYDQRNIYVDNHCTNKYIEYKETVNNINKSNLYNGDCIEILKSIPNNSIDFCFADPPYNINKKYNNWNDGIDIKKYFEWCDLWLAELARIIKPGKTLAILNIPQWCIRHYHFLSSLMDFQNWIVWDALSLPVRMIMPAHYSIICFTKGKPEILPGITRKINSMLEETSLRTVSDKYCSRMNCIEERNSLKIKDKENISDLWWNIHRIKHNSKRSDHPCQLPPNLMFRLISLFTNTGDVVLDPFNGVGTTTLSADILKRIYIGIELSEYYHGISIKRHNEILSNIDPFRKLHNNIPIAKNSRVSRLNKQCYIVSKKNLQLEVKRIKIELGKMPTRSDIIQFGKYPIEYYDKYFIDWGEVTAAAKTTGMTEYKNSNQDTKQFSLFDVIKRNEH
ncbi:MAG: site-specific DNA-methyltransferase [Desulfovibrio sp.]|jgi:site-specific DNA-methyltransferase (adenine-specific)|nr:site-specific DNA-methyltransferase [Desulfovibrio sp.]